MAIIEAARNLLGLSSAGSEEFHQSTKMKDFIPVIYHLKQWTKGKKKIHRTVSDDKGGSMRLGEYPANLTVGSLVAEIYGTSTANLTFPNQLDI